MFVPIDGQEWSTCGHDGFTGVYKGVSGMDGNEAKLKALCAICGIRPKVLADAASVSPAYVSRLFNEQGFRGSPQFWRRVESKLGCLVESRGMAVFAVPVTDEAPAMEFLGEEEISMKH